jgi:formylglycine-generating enzyme required for sulfatase activity/serine/threonine protein kinase
MTAADPLQLVGTTIADKYRVIGVAGEGGFSTVYRAEHLIWKQPVAIKFFNVLEDADPKIREGLLDDFINEGRLMSELSSKSAAIVQARDIGKLNLPNGGWIPYMVLEWLEGAPLDTVISDEQAMGIPPRTLHETMRLLDPVAVALDVAHKRNIAHRDLKPGNIMVLGDPRQPQAVKVLDFGIAKVMADQQHIKDQLQMTGQQITAFTPNYGAPEQFSRSFGATGPWTDVYAMALILIEVLSGGVRALDGGTFFELGVSSCDLNRRPTPRQRGIELGPDVEAVFGRALAVRPEERYASMGDFWSTLHRCLNPDAATWRAPRSMAQPRPSSVPGSYTEPMRSSAPSSALTARPTVTSIGGGSSRSAIVFGGLAVAAVLAGGLGAVAWMGSRNQETTAVPAASAPTAAASAEPTPSAATIDVEWDGPCPKGMKMVAGGAFSMGSDDAGLPLSGPAHKVTLDTFCLDETEVTVAKYRRCVEGGACKPADKKPNFPKAESDSQADHDKQLEAFAELCNWGREGVDNFPINCLDWYRASAYCTALGLRLPSEAEWEFAARGTDGRKFPWGSDTGDATFMNAAGREWRGWLLAHALPEPQSLMYDSHDGYAGTAPVGRFARGRTQSGQLDMVGNVWEWTNDWYAVYKADDQVNPKGPAAGDRKAIRGGGFNGEVPLWVNPASRYHQLATASVHAVGFRCASNVKDQK